MRDLVNRSCICPTCCLGDIGLYRNHLRIKMWLQINLFIQQLFCKEQTIPYKAWGILGSHRGPYTMQNLTSRFGTGFSRPKEFCLLQNFFWFLSPLSQYISGRALCFGGQGLLPERPSCLLSGEHLCPLQTLGLLRSPGGSCGLGLFSCIGESCPVVTSCMVCHHGFAAHISTDVQWDSQSRTFNLVCSLYPLSQQILIENSALCCCILGRMNKVYLWTWNWQRDKCGNLQRPKSEKNRT